MKSCLLLAFAFLALLSGNAAAIEIVLDPGHSPGKPGAMSCIGEKEFRYNDGLVSHIYSKFLDRGVKPELTRSSGIDKTLMERVKNTSGKDLFISIHHDSVQPQFMQFRNKFPVSNKDKGYSIFVSRKNKHFNQSLEYAKKLAENLYASGMRPSRHHGEKIKGENREAIDEKLGIYYFDDLVVLKNAQCPAVLVEAGVIVNPEDEALVRTYDFKEKMAQAIINAAL